MLLKLFKDLLQKRVEQIRLRKSLIHLSIIILVLFFSWNIWFLRNRLEVHTENAIILKDQFSQPVGVGGITVPMIMCSRMYAVRWCG